MPCQRIKTGERSMTMFALERLDSSMQLHMPLAVVLSSESWKESTSYQLCR